MDVRLSPEQRALRDAAAKLVADLGPATVADLDDEGRTRAIETIERPMRADDHARQAAVAHQQVAAETDPLDRHVRRERFEERDEL